ncbi:MAG TPA: F0F1 ATP synthase subunit B [Methylomirabilota bacterium]|nr:F0F1 ATP synthase subunit B [Methylomirabilota bacterium]
MTQGRYAADRPVRGSTVGALAALVGSLLAPALAAAAGGEGGGGLIDVNASLIIQLVNFLILLAVLYRFLYRPLMGALENRTATIKQQLAEAQAAREEAQAQLAEFEARLAASRAEAEAARDRALREAAEVKERLAAEARREAERLVQTARSEIAQDVRRAKADLRAEVGGLAVQIAERLIQKSLRDEDHQRIVRDALARMDARG